MTVFGCYAVLMVVVTNTYAFLLRFFSLYFIYDSLGDLFSITFYVTLVLINFVLAVILIIGYRILKPFDKVIARIKKGGEPASREEVEVCLMSYKYTYVLTIITNVLGFFIGQFLAILIPILNGAVQFYLSRVCMVMLQAMTFGMLSVLTTVFILNSLLTKPRELLNVQNFDGLDKQRGISVGLSIKFVVFEGIAFSLINMFSISYGFFFKLSNGTAYSPEMFASFFQKGLFCLFASVLICAIPALVLIKTIHKRIKQTSDLVEGLAKTGDMKSRINITMIDDFGYLNSTINDLMTQFSSIIKEIKNGSSDITNSADTISVAVTDASTVLHEITQSFNHINNSSTQQEKLIQNADENIKNLTEDVEIVKKHILEQASSMQQTSASITEMNENIVSVAKISQQASEVSLQLSKTSIQGNEAVEKAISSMNEIQTASTEVQQMVKIIQQLASQTNLLAMNAAIEAAHAGEFGRGFAVVADEVRTLANSSAKSTHNIQDHIKDMISKIEAGVTAIGVAGVSFTEISDKIAETNELVNTITNAMEEQKTGAEETMKSTNEVVDAIQSIKELSEKESQNASNVHNLMETVVKASRSTVSAISDSLISAADLQDSISKVDNAASSNKDYVDNMGKLVNNFIL